MSNFDGEGLIKVSEAVKNSQKVKSIQNNVTLHSDQASKINFLNVSFLDRLREGCKSSARISKQYPSNTMSNMRIESLNFIQVGLNQPKQLSENKSLCIFSVGDHNIYNMSKAQTKLLTLNSQLSAKTLKDGCTREEIKQYFLHSYSIYEKLFSLIKHEKSYYTKPEPLRHPLIFYYGHTACVYMNKLLDKGLIPDRINPHFQSIFAVGVDEMDWDDLNDAHYDWPSVRETTTYRQKVKEVVLSVIDNMSPRISWDSDAWVILMGIEHEKIHLETSSVIIRRLPIDEIRPNYEFVDCPLYTTKISQIPKNEMKEVPSFKFEWDRQIKNATVYGWDNQFGEKLIDTKAYKSSKMLVSNGEYLEFVEDKGYEKLQYWDEEGKAWLRSVKVRMPIFWGKNNGDYTLRTMSKVMPLPVDWPVEVNNLEATAFCQWKGKKVGKNYRLPTQDEYLAMRALLSKDELDWEHGEVGNINMEYWFSPNPVNYFKTGQFYDVVGNVWQHCSTPIYPFEKFEIHPIYEDFTTPTFDGRHNMIKGGSFVSTGNQALKHARYAFRRHFYQFAGFRYVESENPVWSQQILDQTDEIVDKFLQIHFLTPKSYAPKVVDIVEKYCKNLDQKCLTVGCSVGRIVLEISKYFLFSYGTDYSARFFQMATRMYEKGFLKYKDVEILTQDLEINRQKIVLYQMNPENPDPKKINDFSVVIFDGLAIRDKRIKKVISCMKQVLRSKCKVIIINTKNRNQVSLEELNEIFGKAEPIHSWIVAESHAQNFDVQISLFEVEQTL